MHINPLRRWFWDLNWTSIDHRQPARDNCSPNPLHILYVHQNFPAQFGHIARHLVKEKGWQCSFVSETPAGDVEGIHKIQYMNTGGATKTTHFCSRTFENAVWHTDGVYNALKACPDLKP